jgi:hypothetical protein
MRKKAGNLVVSTTTDGKISANVRFGEEYVRLTQQQIAELFDTARTNIVEHT